MDEAIIGRLAWYLRTVRCRHCSDWIYPDDAAAEITASTLVELYGADRVRNYFAQVVNRECDREEDA